MCSAWAIIRPRSSKSAVEQSRRSLMLAEKAERIERRAHLLGDRAERAAEDLELDFHVVVTREDERAVSIPSPHPPGGNPAGGAVELEHGRARRPGAARRPASSNAGPGPTSAVRTATSSISPLAVRVAVALLVRPVEALGEVRPERHRQLERLPAVAEIGLALAGQLARLGERAHVRDDVVAPLVARHEPERRQHAGGVRARAPSRSRAPPRARTRAAAPRRRTRRARSRAGRGRARPRRRAARAASRRSRPRPRRRVDARRAPLRPPRGRARGRPASRAGSRPSSRFASVTVGRGSAAAVARRARDRRRRSRARRAARRPRRARRSSRRRRRPCGCRPSAAGSGSPPTSRSRRALRLPVRDQADVGRRPAHVERDRVRRTRPAARRAPRPTTPPAGPETRTSAGCAAASSTSRRRRTSA